MTTDRTAAPTRGTALADRPASAAGRTPAPPTDSFSLLLGAATPKHDTPVRRDDNPSKQREDRPAADKQRRTDEDRRPRRAGDDRRLPVKHGDDTGVAADAAETAAAAADAATDAAAADAKPAVPTTPNIFALQLASPLPPQAPPAGQAQGTPGPLPAFTGQVPASVAAATAAQATASADVTATVVDPAAAANAAATETAATTAADAAKGAIALQGLPAEATADTTLPAGIDFAKPQAQAPAADAPATPAQDPNAQPASLQQNPADAQSQSQQQQPQDPGSAPAQAAAAAAAPQTKPADAPAPVAVQAPTTSPIAPTAAPAMPSTPAVERAVPLSRAVATTGVMVHMMSSKGVDHARLNLKPAELGGIEVRLRSTPNGIHAHLVADSPEAARMLSSAGDDLKRQLEDKNVNLLSLDVSTSDQRQDQPAGFSTDGFGDDRYGRGQNTGRTRADESTLLMDAPAAAETTLVLPDGVHVDVLA